MMGSPVRTGLLVVALSTALLGCKRSEPAADPGAPGEAPSAEEPGAGAETVESELFGMPVPEDATLDERGDTFAHYVVPGEYEEVVEQYREEFSGYRVVEYDQGVKFEARDDSGRSVYVLEGDADDGVMVTYFEEQSDSVPSSAVAASPTGATRVGEVPGTPEAVAGVMGGNTQAGAGAQGGPDGSGGAGSSGTGASGNGNGGVGGQNRANGSVNSVRRHQPRSNRAERGTTNPLGRRPIDFTGEFEPPGNPNAYY